MIFKWKKSILLLALLVILTAGTFSSYAATIGEILSEPEASWVRFDDPDANFSYVGDWSAMSSFAKAYNSTTRHAFEGTVKFNFVGSKIRIISQGTATMKHGVKVIIDGIEDTELDLTNLAGGYYPVLVYEKTGLEYKEHSVTIDLGNRTGNNFYFDAIDIDENGELKPYNENIVNVPDNPSNLTAIAGDTKVDLSWNLATDADSYNVKRSTTSGGPYTTVAQEVYGTSYTDTDVINGTTYYYVVTAVNTGGESGNSNEASATPVAPSTGRALLRITMTNGSINEYDLSMNEVTNFVDWYDSRANGTGKAYYTIDKNYNVGPFASRKDYIIFDKVLQFEVMEYTQQ